MGKCENDRLVFLDETGIKTNLVPIYGWSQRNTRCYDSRPGSYKLSTIISAIRLNGVLSSTCLEGSLDKVNFKYYMEVILLPCLNSGDIVIMDNLSVHKNSFDIDKFRKNEISIKYLPQYSPEFNPIENMWSKFKGIVRSLMPRNFEQICNAMDYALDKITPTNIAGWFRGCGYV